jgi:hypothetical protein
MLKHTKHRMQQQHADKPPFVQSTVSTVLFLGTVAAAVTVLCVQQRLGECTRAPAETLGNPSSGPCKLPLDTRKKQWACMSQMCRFADSRVTWRQDFVSSALVAVVVGLFIFAIMRTLNARVSWQRAWVPVGWMAFGGAILGMLSIRTVRGYIHFHGGERDTWQACSQLVDRMQHEDH